MKLCLIGDSHAAMLIAAHRQAPADETIAIFAKPGLCDADVTIQGSCLHARSPEMVDRLAGTETPTALDLTDFDAVVIAGLAPSAFAAVRLQQDHTVAGWPSGDKALNKALRDGVLGKARPLITRSAYAAALTALTDTSLGTRMARAAPCPVAIVPQPFPSDALLQSDDAYPIFRRVVRQGDGAALAQDLTAAHRAVFDPLPHVTYLLQPKESLSNGCLTQAAFMRGGPRLSEGSAQDAGDVLHGNIQLGARMLDALRLCLRTALKTRSNP